MQHFHQRSHPQQAHQPSPAELDFDALFKQFENGNADDGQAAAVSNSAQQAHAGSLESPPRTETNAFMAFDLVNFGLDAGERTDQREVVAAGPSTQSRIEEHESDLTPSADTWNTQDAAGSNESYQGHMPGASNGQGEQSNLQQGSNEDMMNMSGFEAFQASLLQQQVNTDAVFAV
jgi:hypothetical protein